MTARGCSNLYDCNDSRWVLLATNRLLLVACSGPGVAAPLRTTALAVGGCSLLPVRLLLVGRSGHWCGSSESWGALMPLHQWGLLPKGELQRTWHSMSSISSRAYSATHTNKSNNLRSRVAATLFLLYWSPSQECHHGCPITKGVTKFTGHWMTNEMQGARIILDPFLEHPELGLLLAECQCPQSNFKTGH